MKTPVKNPAPRMVAVNGRGTRPAVRRIVIAFDGSAGAEEALRDLALAGLTDRLEACVLSVSDPATFFSREVGESAGSVVHRVLARSRTGACLRLADQTCGMVSAMFPHWVMEPAALDGPASPAIVATAIERQADLVVMGAHGRSHCQQMLLGSCSRRVLMHSTCSVRIARPRRRLAGGSLRVLVAVDVCDKARARAAIAAVAARSWPANTEVHLVAVVDGDPEWRHRSAEATSVIGKQRQVAVVDTQVAGALQEYWSLLRRTGCKGETILAQGDVPSTLVRYATEWEADCVFIALPLEGGSSGSLADDHAFITAACAPCSVEVVACRNPSHEDVRESASEPERAAVSATAVSARLAAHRVSGRFGPKRS